jgi:glycosyltransferase involved in cell wall biosynthesis
LNQGRKPIGKRMFDSVPETAPPASPSAAAAAEFHVVFDVSDLIHYFRSARLPTGIQRVQLEIVEWAIRKADFGFSIAGFTKEANYWIEIPRELFIALSALSVGHPVESAWQALGARLEALIECRRRFEFPQGAMLLNLGSSWWLQNYFLGVRQAKVGSGIIYVPFIHDLIPIAMPELCVAELRNNFAEWIESVFAHADYFLVNSQNTRRDLLAAAQRAGIEREAVVIRLDADFRNAPTAAAGMDVQRDGAPLLRQLGIEPGQFVLFVSTIEPRKNHAMVFAAWLKLLRRHGPGRCPKLVCVGQRGWLNHEAHARLAASDALMRQIAILSDVSDALLGELYKACICTLYPSRYEGWGLPVTESLCFGKVPVVSRVASHPEAGGSFAEYFEVDSERDLIAAVERVVFDTQHRLSKEQAIATGYRPRHWQEIGADIIDNLRRWSGRRTAPRVNAGAEASRAVPAKCGVFYSLAGEIEHARGHNAHRGEIYRNGDGWWWLEPWGCWIRERGPATIAFAIDAAANAGLCIYLGLKGVQGRDGSCSIRVEGQSIRTALASEQERIVAVRLPPRAGRRQVTLDFTCDRVADFRPSTKGRDFRVCGIGVRWFYVCREDDLRARLNLLETVQLEASARRDVQTQS